MKWNLKHRILNKNIKFFLAVLKFLLLFWATQNKQRSQNGIQRAPKIFLSIFQTSLQKKIKKKTLKLLATATNTLQIMPFKLFIIICTTDKEHTTRSLRYIIIFCTHAFKSTYVICTLKISRIYSSVKRIRLSWDFFYCRLR